MTLPRSSPRCRNTRRRWLLPLLLVLSLALAACGGPDTEELAEAAEATFDDGFGYRVAVRSDPAAVTALGEAGGLLSVISGLELRGVVAGEDGAEVVIEAAGLPVIEIISLEDELYFRGALQDLFGVLGAGAFDPRNEVIPALETLGVSDQMLAATLEAFDGRWIGIIGDLDRDRLAAALGQPAGETDGQAADDAARELFGGDLPELIERFVVVESAEETDEGTLYDVAVDLDALLVALVDLNAQLGTEGTVDAGAIREDLASLPDAVPGQALTVDGTLRRLEIDLAGAARDGGTEVDGELLVTLSFEPEVDAPMAPAEVTTVPADEFVDAVERIADITGLGQ